MSKKWHRMTDYELDENGNGGLRKTQNCCRTTHQNEGVAVRIVRVILLQQPIPFSSDIGREGVLMWGGPTWCSSDGAIGSRVLQTFSGGKNPQNEILLAIFKWSV